MKVGIVVYSQSGHTALFARTIADALREAGIDYSIEMLRPQGIPKHGSRNIELRRVPDISGYDVILLGAPVWAFGMCPVVNAFLRLVDSLKGKNVIPFVTHGLPLSIAPRRALKQMGEACEAMLADVLEGESCHYFFFGKKEEKMKEAAKRIVDRINRLKG